MVDGDLDTEWNDGPQKPGQWVVIDVGEEREVGGVTESLGRVRARLLTPPGG